MSENKTINRKSHYHSTVGRRDFMKMLGIGSGALALAGVGEETYASFNDLDEMIASPYSNRKLPWWVKEVDNPTLGIDFENGEIHPGFQMTSFARTGWPDPTEFDRNAMAIAKWKKEAMDKKLPGHHLRDQAMLDANGWGRRAPCAATPPFEHPLFFNKGADPNGSFPFFKTPEDRGVPKYTGTPEENTKMIRLAGRLFGAADVGVVQLDEKTRKLLYANVVFEDVEKGYTRADGKFVLPSKKDLYVICSIIPQSLFLGQFGHAEDAMAWGGLTNRAYSECSIYVNRLKLFLRGLGYQHLGQSTTGLGRSVPFGIMSGLGEGSRASILCSPQFGTNLRSTVLTVTDLPLAPTKPIDAGIVKFCRVCMKCADTCPSGSISKDKDPVWNGGGYNSAVGYEAWFINTYTCHFHMQRTGCIRCQMTCPFTKFDTAVMHDLIKIAIAKAPMLGAAIHAMDDIFGYGANPPLDKSPWDVDPMDMPLNGMDHSRS